MKWELLTALICLASVRLSEAAVPVITGTNTQTLTVSEAVANGGTAFTIVADIAVLCTLTGTDAGSFAVTPTTGGSAGTTCTVTITTSPVYATKHTYSLNVVAADGANAGDTATVAVTLNVNPNPVIPTACASDGLTAGGVVYTPAFTLLSSSTLTATYSIQSGNTNTDFTISSSTGAISVASGKTLSATTTPIYSLVVRAVDSATTAQTGDSTITVVVSSNCPTSTCSGASMITGSALAILFLIFSLKMF